MMVEAWLERAAASRGGTLAIETPQGDLSYTELLMRARAGAQSLREQGVIRGEKVAIALAPGLGFLTALHSCMLLGAVAVPVDLRMNSTERAHIIDGVAVVLEDPLPIQIDAASSASSAGHDLSDTLAIIHTSGTTSAPKPIELTYGNFLWSALGSAVALGSDPDERWLCALPLSHVGGLSILIRSVIGQSTAVVHERFEADRVLHALRDEAITICSLVATTLQRLLDSGLEAPPALRCALTGGGPVPVALLERARAAAVPVLQTYGLTEACSQVTSTPLAALGEDPQTSGAGPPLFCTQVSLAADGEILIAGPTVARASLDADGWLHTGDLGAVDVDGTLRITGRKADTIVSGGENIAPIEIEAVLEAHPLVLEAAVVGRADEQWGEAVVAIVVPREDAVVDQELLRAHCAQRLAPYKVPKRVTFTSEPLPRTRSGKLLRRELQAVGGSSPSWPND
jgi:o-succinylbenzoate---CoA ligase